MKILLILSAVLNVAALTSDVRQLFREAMRKYGPRDHIVLKSASADMMEKRFQSFVKFHAVVESINNDPSLPYTAADNFMSILTDEERERYHGVNASLPRDEDMPEEERRIVRRDDTEIPEQRDFSDILPPVKDQGDCGSCWIFSAAASLEGEIYFTTGQRVSVSEQEFVDCVIVSRDSCGGGWPSYCFRYLERKQQIAPSSSYPYWPMDPGYCRRDSSKPNLFRDLGIFSRGRERLSRMEEALLIGAASHVVSVTIHANYRFKAYESGIYVDDDCHYKVNHAVDVVGYGKQDGRKYWKIRNSWGADWGEAGYMLMDREVENMCYIAEYGQYPALECRSWRTCHGKTPDEGDKFTGDDDDDKTKEEDRSYDDENFVERSLSSCMKLYSAAFKKCDSRSGCVVGYVKSNCFLGSDANSAGKNQVFVHKSLDGREGESVCKEEVELSERLKSKDKAREKCKDSVEAEKCVMVQQDKFWYASVGKKTPGSTRWMDVNYKC